MKYKRPVIPVRLHSGAELPFRLSSRQFVDFSDSFDTGLARLRNHLSWTRSPAGVLQDLRNRRADAEYELPRADPAQRLRIMEELAELDRRIEEQQRMVETPRAVVEQTDGRIEAGMERERQPERPVVAAPRAKFVNPPPMSAPSYFQDRHVESELIGAFLREDGARLMSVVGRGGIGKTAMVCRLLKALEGGRLPDELGELAVDGIVYLSPVGAHPVNFPNLFSDLCRLLSADLAEPLLARYRDPQATPAALMRALLEAFPSGRTVVLLDNFADLVDAETFGLTDAALDEALRAVLSAPAHWGQGDHHDSRRAAGVAAGGAWGPASPGPRRRSALAVCRGGSARAMRTAGWGSKTHRPPCSPRRGSAREGFREHWRRWSRSSPPTATPRCPSCSPTLSGCPRTSSRSSSAKRSAGWMRKRSRSCRR